MNTCVNRSDIKKNSMRYAIQGASAIALYLLFSFVGMQVSAMQQTAVAPVCKEVAPLAEITITQAARSIMQGEQKVIQGLSSMRPHLAGDIVQRIQFLTAKPYIVDELERFFITDEQMSEWLTIENSLKKAESLEQMVQIIKANPTLLNVAFIRPDDVEKNTLLHLAVEQGKTDLVRVLLKAGAPVDLSNSWGYTPLMIAVIANYPLIVQELLAHGADVNKQKGDGQTALMLATVGKNLPVIKVLLRHKKINPLLQNIAFVNAFDLALRTKAPPEIIAVLEDATRAARLAQSGAQPAR